MVRAMQTTSTSSADLLVALVVLLVMVGVSFTAGYGVAYMRHVRRPKE
jgi:CHASE3 domain sensor protein